MAFDQKTRNLLQRTVAACRRVLDREFTAQLQELYGIQPDGSLTPITALDHLGDEGLDVARLLRERINHLEGGSAVESFTRTKAKPEHIARVIREQAFTVLNRLAALRLCEERGLVLECVRKGVNSEGFQLFTSSAGNALGETHEAYRVYLHCLFDELALDLGVLFDRFSPLALLFPRHAALTEVLSELNGTGKAAEREEMPPEQFAEIWQADETIGWIYQYYNDETERKKMREESAAPRNSRELAVRNQFFTPRYVVEFLTDNTLGRIWYEMTRGETKLKEQCRYLVRRPNEIFLGSLHHTYRAIYGNEAVIPEDLDRTDAFAALYRGDMQPAASGKPGFFALAGGALSEESFRAATGESWEQHGNECLAELTQAIVEGREHPKKNDLVWGWAAIAQHLENSQTGSPYARESTQKLEAYFRELLQNSSRAEDLSQEELLRQPVLIPYRPLKDPRTILMLDPACGSMHFGLYAFDLFEVIYDEAWALEDKLGAEALSRPPGMKSLQATYAGKDDFLKDVPRLIIEHNIHGIDIDPRAAQIAGLALWLRAQNAWKAMDLKPAERPRIKRSNIVCAEPMPGEKELLREFVEREFPAAERAVCLRLLEAIFDKMQLAGEAGSLLKIEEEIRSAIAEAKKSWEERRQEFFDPAALTNLSRRPGTQRELPALNPQLPSLHGSDESFWERLEEKIYAALRDYAEQAESGGAFQRRLFAEDAARGFAFIDVCRKRYDTWAMNPPFGAVSTRYQSKYAATYPLSKADMACAFVERAMSLTSSGGRVGVLMTRTPFFLSSFAKWRIDRIIAEGGLQVFADLGFGVLDAMVETCAFVLQPTVFDGSSQAAPVSSKSKINLGNAS